jgi:hypothetical protein
VGKKEGSNYNSHAGAIYLHPNKLRAIKFQKNCSVRNSSLLNIAETNKQQ